MDFLIIVKWNTNYTGHTSEAPSIIVTIVNFFLKGGEVKGRDLIPANAFVSQILLCKCSRDYVECVQVWKVSSLTHT